MNWYNVIRATLVGNLYHQLRLSGLPPPAIPPIFNIMIQHWIVLYTVYKEMTLAMVMTAYFCYAATNTLAFNLQKPKAASILRFLAAAVITQVMVNVIQPSAAETVFDCTPDASTKMATYSLSSVG